MHDLTRRILVARLRKPRNQARVVKDRLQSRCLEYRQVSTTAGDSVEPNTPRKDALQARVPWPAHQQKVSTPFSHTFLTAVPPGK
jgi:hypothetical protein